MTIYFEALKAQRSFGENDEVIAIVTHCENKVENTFSLNT